MTDLSELEGNCSGKHNWKHIGNSWICYYYRCASCNKKRILWKKPKEINPKPLFK